MLAIWEFIKSPVGRWLVLAFVVAGMCAGSFLRGEHQSDLEWEAKQAKERAAYEAEIAKKAAIINDQNVAFAKNEAAHKAKEAGLQAKYEADLAAAGKKPQNCWDSQEATDDLNALIVQKKGDAK